MGIDSLKSKTWTQNNFFVVEFMGGPLAGLDYNVKSISMPDFTRSATEEYNNGTWQFTHGRQEIYQIAITFWDNEQDLVYEKVLGWWDESHLKYTEEKQFNFSVKKTKRSNRESPIAGIKFKDAIIDSISGLQWDNSSQSQIVEFTVNIKAAKHEITG
jgi:hypothetical protein